MENNVMTKLDWSEQSEGIEEFLKAYGYDVVYETDTQDRVEFEDKLVYINSSTWPETRFYTLLHEYGHVEIYEVCRDEFSADVPRYYVIQDGRSERSHAVRVSTVAEEIEAWRRGRWLARTEGFYIDEEKYDKHMTRALMSYINWAADGGDRD